MSQVIDTKVVEMQFDNSKFEKNIEVSLNSLKHLDENIEHAGKNRNSFEGLAKASSKVGLSFDNIYQKSKLSFHMMDLLAGAGTKAFDKISDAVANFALNMANSLSGMKAMRDGFAEYELKMGSVQTILAGAKIKNPLWSKENAKNLDANGKKIKQYVTDSGQRLDIVNKKLEELNAYSDRTIYSFRDMTSNIGKFTNAGVDLDTAVQAIQGVANVAAVSGANANEASRAMYNFAQALSSGNVKLIDWKSIENANMATVEFKQQLLDTAVAMGTVVKVGNKYNSVTMDAKGHIAEGFTSTLKFNDSLSSQWMTTKVLTQTLKNYSTNVSDMTDKQKEAYKKQLIGLGYTEKQANKIMKLGVKAAKSATEVKTFSQMMDTLAESLGSSWAQTFEIIIGDFKEAKKLWTGVNNVLDGILTRSGKVRNEVLTLWKAAGGRKDMLKGFKNLYKSISGMLVPVKELWEAFTPTKEHTVEILINITKKFKELSKSLLDLTPQIAEELREILKPAVDLGNYISKNMPKILSVIKTVLGIAFKGLVAGIKVLSDVRRAVYSVLGKVITKIIAFGKILLNTYRNIQTKIKNSQYIQDLIIGFNELKTAIQDLFGRVVRNASVFAGRFTAYLGKLWKAISPLLSAAVMKVITKLSSFILPKLRKALSFVTDKLVSLADYIDSLNLEDTKFYKFFAGLPDKITELSNNNKIKKFFASIRDFGNDAVGFLSDKFDKLKTSIEAITMPTGLNDVFTNVKNFLGGVFGKTDISTENTADISDGMPTDQDTQQLSGFHDFLDKLKIVFDGVKDAANFAKNAIKDFITFIIDNTPKAFTAIHDFLAGDDGILTISDVSEAIYTASYALSSLLTSMGFESLGDGIKSIGEAFGDLTTSINNFLKQGANKARMSAIKDFAIAIGILVGALYILSKIPTDALLGAVSALGIVGIGLIKFFDKISSTNYSGAQVAGFLSLAALLVSIGVAFAGVTASIGLLIGALYLFPKVIKQYNELGAEFETGMKRVGEVLGKIFEYLDHSLSGKFALRSAVALYLLVATLNKMRNTIIEFAKDDVGDSMENGLFRIQQIVKMLADFLGDITLLNFTGINVGINLNTVGIAAMIWALGGLLTKIVPVIKEAGSLTFQEIGTGMDVISKILWRLGIFLTAMNAGSLLKLIGGGTNLREWIGISLTLGLITNAISSIVGGIKTLTELASGEHAEGFDDAIDTIQGIFIGLTLLMAVIGKCKPAGAGVLFTLSVSIGLLTLCVMMLAPLADKNPMALAEAVGALGGLMIALGAAMWLTGKASGKTTPGDILKLIVMTGSMVILAETIRHLSKAGGSAGSIIAAAAAIATAVGSMAGALWGLSKIKKIPTSVLVGLGIFAAAIWGLAFAIKAFKSSSSGMESSADTVVESAEKATDGAVEGVSSHLKMIDIKSILGPIFDKIGPTISEYLGNIDLGGAISNMWTQFKESAKSWAQDAIDIGTNLIDGLSKAISDPGNVEKIKESMVNLGKSLLESFKLFFGIKSPSTVMEEQGGFILDGLVQGLMAYPEKLADWITGIGGTIVNGVGSFFSGAVEKGKTLVKGIGTGIQNGKKFIVKKAEDLGKAAVKKVGKVNEWAGQAVKSANAFGSKLQSSKNPIKRAAGSMIVGATTVVQGMSKTYKTFASNAVGKFNAEIKAGTNSAKAAGKALVAGAKAAFDNIKNSFTTYGKWAAEGFRNGINNLIASVAEKAAEMVRRAKERAKAEENASSPSKDFMEYGEWAAQGYAIGMTNRKSIRFIEKNASEMVRSAKDVVTGYKFGASSSLYLDSNPAVSSLAYAMSQISDTIDGNIDSGLTIKPVIDMSNVNQSASAMASLFGDRRFKANVDATRYIQTDFERALAHQNGLNSMKAIDRLSNRIDAMTETMNSRSLNVYNTIDGVADPEGFAGQLINSFRLNARTV